MARRQQRQSSSPIAGIVAILFVAMMLWIAFSAVKGVFAILSWLALPLFVLAIIMNYKVVTGYIQWVFDKIKTDPVKGLLIAGGSVIGYPLVSAWLAFKAFTTKKMARSGGQEKKGDYVKYEEVEEDDDFLELEDLDKVKTKQKQAQPQSRDNNYDDLFE